MKRNNGLLACLLVFLLLVGGTLVFLRVTPAASALSLFQKIPEAQESLGAEPDSSFPVGDSLGSFPLSLPSGTAETAGGRAILEAAVSRRRCTLLGSCEAEGRKAEQRLRVSAFDPEQLAADLAGEMLPLLQERVDAAEREEDIYENGAYRTEILEDAFMAALASLLAAPERYTAESELTLSLTYTDGAWTAANLPELDAALLGSLPDAAAADARAAALLQRAAAELPCLPVPIRYSIDEYALAGPVPNPACYGETQDPAVIEELLQRPEAQKLIGDETPVWNRNIERFPPNPTIRWYLDETILVLVWQEVEARGCGTFSEVFIADGSQLRRSIAGDEPFSFYFKTASKFAQDTNAVLALGGDFYHHGRACGISFYQRELIRFEPHTCDVCYITADGDMLFSYRDQFSTEEEAKQFVADNDVLFSLVFGPVLIDEGVDVTPESYAWGEIRDTYARSALGMLGRHHYLTMNLNCYGYNEYYYLATLRQAADAMIARGCYKAYTLDGGQTATTVFGGQLINPVQFGWEKDISDVIYFATAVPNE